MSKTHHGLLTALSLSADAGCGSPEEFDCALEVQNDAGEEINNGAYPVLVRE